MPRKRAIDLNCDLGELAGDDARTLDTELLKVISSANIACGFHAGDPHIMRRTVETAVEHGVRIGAHPGLNDRNGFGRRTIPITPSELRDVFAYQIGAISAFAQAAGQRLQHVKMHGALVEMARADESLARAMCAAVRDFDASLIWLAPTGVGAEAAAGMGLRMAREFYADRAYQSNGSLVSRTLPGAVVEDLDEIEDRLSQLFTAETVTTIDGHVVPIAFDSICVHGDTRQALEIIRVVRDVCAQQNIAIEPLAKIFG
jgi:5-oxoprolinase (ATP-hydrolysing) subunit A